MIHLNVEKNKTISDYEAFFILVEKLIKEKTEQGTKGIIIAKDQENEKKFTYIQAYKVLEKIETCDGLKGRFSMGVCDTCKNFDSSKYAAGVSAMGTCKISKKEHYCYDTCDKHSKEGGGFGI